MYRIYSKLSNFNELEHTKRELKDLLERAYVNPSENLLFKIAKTSDRLLKLLEQNSPNDKDDGPLHKKKCGHSKMGTTEVIYGLVK